MPSEVKKEENRHVVRRIYKKDDYIQIRFNTYQFFNGAKEVD